MRSERSCAEGSTPQMHGLHGADAGSKDLQAAFSQLKKVTSAYGLGEVFWRFIRCRKWAYGQMRLSVRYPAMSKCGEIIKHIQGLPCSLVFRKSLFFCVASVKFCP
ncbi:unnamed protein product [Cylicocyclus nassatus]|uniref:Uncharacterized protein n=1 Tax=Cylicocyclus nassatus TaxID=53992 RepID=A0AA36MI46_CYLNA|nr:unnamed protein product [Cylicocyclus nassatus]